MKYIKQSLLLLAVLFVLSACSSGFLDTELNENASEEQIQESIENDPTKVQVYITGFYKNLFAPEARSSHDDFGLKAVELATDLMGSDMAYLTSHLFVYDYNLDNRGAAYRRPSSTWQQFYAVISGANQVISLMGHLEESDDAVIQQMLGESYTVRAYSYFWLINLFQHPYQWNKDAYGIPLYNESETRLNRVPVKEIYAQMLSDIDKGYNLLKGKGIPKRDHLNEFAAAAIYANILAFVNDHPNQWKEVAKYATLATQVGSLMSEKELTSGFNSLDIDEVIWGADIDSESNTFYASFMSHIDPFSQGYGGTMGNYKMIASELYDKIPDTDLRKKWFGIEIKSKDNPHYAHQKYIQVKFLDVATTKTGDVFSSDYIYLRAGEMYLLAAEAYYNDGNEAEAKKMLETLVKSRNPEYSATMSGEALLDEIKLQKRIEMWGEGRRLLDMKRRGEDLDRTASVNHNKNAIQNPQKLKANDARFIYLIPNRELNGNNEIEEQNK